MTDDKKFEFDPDSVLPKLTKLALTDLPNGTWPAAEIPSGPEHWYRYAMMYKEAADRLADMMDHTYERNMLGPPMMFLYRHCIELHLKSLLLDAGQFLDDPQTVPPKHYLEKLWLRVRAMILKVGNSVDEWVLRADDIIQQFEKLDPTSFAFRYPVDNDGAPSLPEGVLIDPTVVKQMMSELDILLNGASNQIAEYQSLKYEGY